MGKMTKTLLALSLTGLGSGLLFASGLIDVNNLPALHVALPAGAIFFGLFLISLMLEKESARFDEEHQQTSTPSVEAKSLGPENSRRPPKGHSLVSRAA